MKIIVYLFLVIFLLFALTCKDKPTAPIMDNPLDNQNPQTQGDPFNLRATIANGGVTLTWAPLENLKVHRYAIYRAEKETGPFDKLAVVNAQTFQYIDQTVQNGYSYWYKIIAMDEQNRESSHSNVAGVQINMEPVITINGNEPYTAKRQVSLTILAGAAQQMWISNNPEFSQGRWENYSTTRTWILPSGPGPKTVYLKVKFSNGEISAIVHDTIEPQPMNPTIIIANNEPYTSTRQVTLQLSASGYNLQMKVSEDSTFAGKSYESFSPTKNFLLSLGAGTKTVYAKFKNDFDIESPVIFDTIEPQPMNPTMKIANDAHYTATRQVTLQLSAVGHNLQMKVSEDSTFKAVSWVNYLSNFDYSLSEKDGIKTVFVKFKNDFEIESERLSKKIILDTKKPVAQFTVNPKSGITLETNFQFDASATSDNITPAKDIYIRWDFDNNGVFEVDWTTTKVQNYTYPLGGGNKTVKLQVRDGAGWINETTQNIFVNTRPTAVFSFSHDISNPFKIYFDASASNDYEDGKNLQYHWDLLGNGVWMVWQSQPTISYTYPNNFNIATVVLEVKDNDGLISQMIQRIVNSLGETIFIPGGTFEMGDTFGDGLTHEKPVHQVTVGDFYLSTTEVTNAQFATFLNAYGKDTDDNGQKMIYEHEWGVRKRGSRWEPQPGYENHPVVNVTWYGAAQFCKFAKGRLPTEAEWEYAAREGGKKIKWSGTSNETTLRHYAWYEVNSGATTHAVATKQHNALGLYDMNGNVGEWCQDWYGSYSSSPSFNPQGPPTGVSRVVRGGSWASSADNLRCTARNDFTPGNFNSNVGFRLCRPVQ